MLTKEFFDKYFKTHEKIVLYTPDNIPMTVSKVYHFHMNIECGLISQGGTKVHRYYRAYC